MNSRCLDARSAENWVSAAEAGTIAGGTKERNANVIARRRKPRLSAPSTLEIVGTEEFMNTPDLTALGRGNLQKQSIGLGADYKAIPGRSNYAAYQSECGDHRMQERHCVSVHWCRQAGQTPPVSNVFHSCPQVQNHLSSLRGEQPQSGQRMREPEESWLLSSSSSRSRTVDNLSTFATNNSSFLSLARHSAT